MLRFWRSDSAGGEEAQTSDERAIPVHTQSKRSEWDRNAEVDIKSEWKIN